MQKKTNLFQKMSLVSGVVSFILAVVSAVLLYLRVDEGSNDPITASLLASVFFFIFVGIILTIMGRCNMPSFKVD